MIDNVVLVMWLAFCFYCVLICWVLFLLLSLRGWKSWCIFKHNCNNYCPKIYRVTILLLRLLTYIICLALYKCVQLVLETLLFNIIYNINELLNATPEVIWCHQETRLVCSHAGGSVSLYSTIHTVTMSACWSLLVLMFTMFIAR